MEQMCKAVLKAATDAEVYHSSFCSAKEGAALMFSRDGEEFLGVSGPMADLFAGEDMGGWKCCPTDHKNRLVLNEVFPFTAPVSLGNKGTTFGMGDRLGFAGAAQVRAIKKVNVRPVLAQQSLRELTLTHRTLEEVIDRAAWAVFREGYRLGYSCDGDHLKTVEEVQKAIESGCTMITLDCSLALNSGHAGIPDEEWERLTYLQGTGPKDLGLGFSSDLLVKLHRIYDGALVLCKQVYFDCILLAPRAIDLELSLDETEETTTPEAHYFVARELERSGVCITGLAPRFVGEFQKAIEYIGDISELERTMAVHAAIAKHFGYRLSLHSGSEKYSVLPVLMRTTGGNCHVKTSGTSWLEVVEVISRSDPALYRRIHAEALNGIEEAKKQYVVHCDPSRVKPVESVPDADLPRFLEQDQPDSRQLLHITYGRVLGIPDLKKDILDFLKKNRALYEAEAEELYDRHFAALFGTI